MWVLSTGSPLLTQRLLLRFQNALGSTRLSEQWHLRNGWQGNPSTWCLLAGNSSSPPLRRAPPARPPGLTCVTTPWLAFLRRPRPSLHNERGRKKPESSPHAQPPRSQPARPGGPGSPPPAARRPAACPELGGPRPRPPSVPPQPPDFLQPRTAERCACPSPRQRVVLMAPSGWPTPRLAPSTSAD